MRELLFLRRKKAARRNQHSPKSSACQQLPTARNLRIAAATLGSRMRLGKQPSQSLNTAFQ